MLDPQLRELAEKNSKALLDKVAETVRAAGLACVSHVVVEHTWETVSHAVCGAS